MVDLSFVGSTIIHTPKILKTSSSPELLCQIIQYFVTHVKTLLQTIFRLATNNIGLKETVNLSFLFTGAIQEFPDNVHNALALLQQPLHSELLCIFPKNSEKLYLVQHLQYPGRTIRCRTQVHESDNGSDRIQYGTRRNPIVSCRI